MKKILFIAVTAVMAFSSCQSSKVNISGRFVGLDANMVYLEQSTPLEQAIIDSVALNEEGEFKLTCGCTGFPHCLPARSGKNHWQAAAWPGGHAPR